MKYETNSRRIGSTTDAAQLLRRAALGAALAVGLGGAGVASAQSQTDASGAAAQQEGGAQQAGQRQSGQAGQQGHGRGQSQVKPEEVRQAVQQGEEIRVSSKQIAQIVVLFPADQSSLRASGASGGQRITRTDQRQSGAGGSAAAGGGANTLSLIFVAEDSGGSQVAQQGQGQQGGEAQQGQDQQGQAQQAGAQQGQGQQGQGQQGQNIDPNAVAILAAADSTNGVATLAMAPTGKDQNLRVAAMMGGKPVKVSSGSQQQQNMHVLTIKGQGGSGGQSGQQAGQSQGQAAEAVVLVYLSDMGSQSGQSGSGAGTTSGRQSGQQNR